MLIVLPYNKYMKYAYMFISTLILFYGINRRWSHSQPCKNFRCPTCVSYDLNNIHIKYYCVLLQFRFYHPSYDFTCSEITV
ncbi:hypothetical protein Hanom_Chr05g00390291 [Helianthus anomalus]